MINSTMPGVRLRVTVTIDIDAADYLEAGEHQKRVEKYVDTVRDEYPSAWLTVRQRRQTKSRQTASQRVLRVSSGRLSSYD